MSHWLYGVFAEGLSFRKAALMDLQQSRKLLGQDILLMTVIAQPQIGLARRKRTNS